MAPRPTRPFATAGSAPAATAPEASSAIPEIGATLAAAIDRCWRRAAAPAEWNLTREQFQVALERSAARRFPGAVDPDPRKIEAYWDTLHAADLALAIACGLGNAVAWDFFMAEFRPELYRAARAIAGHADALDSSGRDLADSLYADLYGLRETEGRRKSLFEYFHGRSKLTTWLHAVLAQRHVDEIRRARRTEPIEDESGEARDDLRDAAGDPFAAPGAAGSPPDPERANYLAVLQAALAAALQSLEPRDRLRLAYYYADDRTLAEIGRLLGEHEATVSRKLERTRREVRARVESSLREGKKWSEAQIRACLECARGEWPFDLTAALQSAAPAARRETAGGARQDAAARKI